MIRFIHIIKIFKKLKIDFHREKSITYKFLKNNLRNQVRTQIILKMSSNKIKQSKKTNKNPAKLNILNFIKAALLLETSIKIFRMEFIKQSIKKCPITNFIIFGTMYR